MLGFVIGGAAVTLALGVLWGLLVHLLLFHVNLSKSASSRHCPALLRAHPHRRRGRLWWWCLCLIRSAPRHDHVRVPEVAVSPAAASPGQEAA